MTEITTADVLIRLGLAALAGGTVGYDRERHGRAAGLRTMLLAGVAAAAAAVLACYLLNDLQTSSWRPDPGRVLQGVLAGIGFLGAGSIIREGNVVRGVTTAATLWFVTVIGLALGSGYFLLAGVAWAISVIALVLLPYAERLISYEIHKVLIVTIAADSPLEGQIRTDIVSASGTIVELNYEIDNVAGTRTIHYHFSYHRRNGKFISDTLIDKLARNPGVMRIELL